ncbi:STING domain-containing protein [Spirosoma sp. KUDC1026]|uniref:STING domain-containing protein n=1 Tax=Spirosoma sp. KUDC1026 TaxID=2745947 RepID=UPI00159B89AC|nr:STING domain-containing protein [Spirosoma sp. KUDC1026]QKZ12860.1 nucleotide-binding protein [Spirosoma sp. KUDC1026]
MTDLKPKIFIGSSRAGYAIAEKVKNYLSDVGDCFLWKEPGIWEPNRSTFDNLLRMASYFDFGIFVATADDLTLTSDDKLVVEPRDNVILEMSLFLGAMGRDKSFLLVEKGIKLPSDFDGIYMPRFEGNDDGSIEGACREYASKIEEHYRLGHLSLYPTTALAIGYYKNFVSGLVDSIQNADTLEIDGVRFTDFTLKVVVPSDLQGMIREKASMFYRRHGFVENAMKTRFRKHPAWFQLDSKNAPHAIMYDMPSTLTGIDDAIEMILQKGHQGRTKMQEIIEQRELNNFRRVLQIQLDKSPFAKSTVEIIDEF